MKIVKVTYTAKPEYVEQNKANIRQVMSDLKNINNPDIRYDAMIGEDGRSFTHFTFFKSDGAEQILKELESFKYFGAQLKANGLDTPPVLEHLTLVGSSY